MDYKQLLELKGKRAKALEEARAAKAAKDLKEYQAKLTEAKSLGDDIEAEEALMAEEGRFPEEDEGMKALHIQKQTEKQDAAKLAKADEIRSGGEYAKAWCEALATGVSVAKASKRENLAPLVKALSIAGGTPAGGDGGFLVPIEFDNMITRKMKELVDLSAFFRVEQVRGLTGWRVLEASATPKPMPCIDELGTIGKDDQPAFEKVTYAAKKYADRLVVSRELLDDNSAGLMAYLADWFGPKLVATKNSLLLGLLNGQTMAPLAAGKEVAGLKHILNTKLNSAHSKSSILLTNGEGYDIMDNWVDTNGRGLLVPNPADADVNRFKSRPVHWADIDLIPNLETGTGQNKKTHAPIYVGCFKAFGTLFIRKALEFAATDVGGDAWATDSVEIRGIARMDAQKMDGNAVVLTGVDLAPAPEGGA